MSTKKKSNSSRSAKTKAKVYVSEDEEEAFASNFDVTEKLVSKDFPKYFVKEMRGEDVTLEHFQKQGFGIPLFIPDKSGLHLTVPDPSFTVSDVRSMVGGKRILEVMNCATQLNSEMTMKDWEEFFMHPNRDDTKLNVISLEFSQTRLENYVSAPRVVRQIDWVDNVWPRHLKDDQEDGTNSMNKMKYPKVQKYCLMTVAGCYTDFHIDFGGTSVWYHVLRGVKVFWLIPPTDANLKLYEEWTLSGKQGDVFFGDTVEKCGRIMVKAGSTLFIPSGWIHAVYTPEDSLVFGGNFLHSFAIEKQLRVAQIEELTKVPSKYRFPFFTELQWYALDKYVYALLGRTHLSVEEAVLIQLYGEKWERDEYKLGIGHPHLTPQELYGLKAIVMFIHALPVTRKMVPKLIKDPVGLIRDIRTIVETHKNDTDDKAVTGKPLLYWPGLKNDKKWGKMKQFKRESQSQNSVKTKQKRVPCKACEGCLVAVCGSCQACTSLPRRRCVNKRCSQPVLDVATTCSYCGLDGWYASPSMSLVDRPLETNALMECSVCLRVVHPTCETDYGVEGVISTDQPNTWHCPNCMKFHPPDPDSEPPAKTVKLEQDVGGGAEKDEGFVVRGTSDQSKLELRVQMAEKIMAASKKQLKPPSYVFRPPPRIVKAEDVYEKRKKKPDLDLKLEDIVMLPVFKYLTSADLATSGCVCKAWHTISLDPSLWTVVDLTSRKITPHLLSITVQKQPVGLLLDWSNMGKQQLNWLLPRIPQTKDLSLVGLEYTMTVSALNTCNCPMLQELNLSFVANLNDAALHKLLTTPRDNRPGLLDKKSRLKNLKKLFLKNTEVSDISLRYITQYLPQLQYLAVSGCWKLSDAGLAQLGMIESSTCDNLTALDLSYCRSLTDSGLASLHRCTNLTRLDASNTQMTSEGLAKFVSNSKHKLKLYGSVVDKKQAVGRRKK